MIVLDEDVDIRKLIEILRTEQRHLQELKQRKNDWEKLRIAGFLGLFSFTNRKQKKRSIELLNGLIKACEENIERYKQMIEDNMELS